MWGDHAMLTRIFRTAAFAALMIISACVTKPQYNQVEEELEAYRSNQNVLEKDLEQAEAEIRQRDTDLRQCLESKAEFQTIAKNTTAQNVYLNKINRQLLEKIKRLRQDLDKKKSVIQLQGQVIRLLDDTKKTIETSLKDQIAAQEIEVVEEDDQLKVIFVDKILFDSGSAKINKRGMELLQIMANPLKANKEQNIMVEGHTDNVPLSERLKNRFPSNWELSTARAAAVVRFFQKQAGIEPERLSATGYSFYRPVAPNTTEEGRHQNRRIEIILGQEKN
jgi:chemotaxis protein MotB